MAPSRARSNSNANPRSFSPNVPRQTPRQRAKRGSVQAAPSTFTPASTAAARMDNAPTPEPSVDVGMSPASRYYKNLRVLRRYDPHITSIFDQFAHVTLYYQRDENKLERAGYEGAMFFFERDIKPTYGFFILNRQGMTDYIRYLLPTDVFEPANNLVWISTLNSEGRSIMGDEDKTAGLWAMPMDVRESLDDMMMRLKDYINKGEPYPEEFRYGPDRIAPQQTYIDGYSNHDMLAGMEDETRAKVIKAMQSNSNAKANANAAAEASANASAIPINVPPPSRSNMSELDQLFSKLTSAAPPPSDPTPPASQQPLTGQALLDTMFASVADFAAPRANGRLTLEQLGFAPMVSSPPEDMEILSPKPSAAGLPQILTTDVIHKLMGLPLLDSRSASRTSTSASASEQQRSPSSAGAHRSRERGYYADRGEDDGGVSEASMSIDIESEAGVNVFGRVAPGARPPFLSMTSSSSAGTSTGDATPRARMESLGLASPPTRIRPGVMHSVSDAQAQTLGMGTAPGASRGSGTQAVAGSRTVSAPSTVRVPFQSGAELWPDSGPGVDGETYAHGLEREDAGGDAVVELDFSEIRVLGDMRAFEAKGSGGRKGEGVVKSKEKKEKEKANGVQTNGTIRQGARPLKKEKERERQQGENSVIARNVASPNNMDTRSLTPSISNMTWVRPHVPVRPADVLRDVVEDSLRSALIESGLVRANGQTLERNALVREVLTLIHTDKSFVDRLYQSYLSLVSGST